MKVQMMLNEMHISKVKKKGILNENFETFLTKRCLTRLAIKLWAVE